MIQEDGWEPSD